MASMAKYKYQPDFNEYNGPTLQCLITQLSSGMTIKKHETEFNYGNRENQ